MDIYRRFFDLLEELNEIKRSDNHSTAEVGEAVIISVEDIDDTIPTKGLLPE